jgi:hypothetical protein
MHPEFRGLGEYDRSSTFLHLRHNQMVNHDECLIVGPDRPDRPDRRYCKPGTGKVVTWDIDHSLFLFLQIASLYPILPVP